MWKEYFTVITKKNQVLWQIDAQRFIIPAEEEIKKTKTNKKSKK
jgi:hypothetical protein